MNLKMFYNQPVAIGGIGGSGTRVVAEILNKSGFYIGSDLNAANDNLWFTLLFKRAELLTEGTKKSELLTSIRLFENIMVYRRPLTNNECNYIEKIASEDRPQHILSWLQERKESLYRAVKEPAQPGRLWGWKEPNAHLFLGEIEKELPGIKYIHVMRHGLDMAYSTNQNQLKLWGPIFLDPEKASVIPRNSLKFWCFAHRRIINMGQKMGSRFLLLNFDELCSNPRQNLSSIFNFIAAEPKAQGIDDILKSIKKPISTGRYKQYSLDSFDPEDVEYVRNLGFTIEN